MQMQLISFNDISPHEPPLQAGLLHAPLLFHILEVLIDKLHRSQPIIFFYIENGILGIVSTMLNNTRL